MAKRKDKPTRARTSKTDKGRAAQAKAAAAAESKAKHTALLNELRPIAKEINYKFEQAAKLDGKADDNRLSAALRLAEAKTKCEAGKLSFKSWCEENVKEQSYETIRKLATVGASAEPAKALADMRGKNKDANRKARARKAGAGETVGTYDPTKPATPFERAEEALAALDDQVRLNLVESQAGKLALAVVNKDDAKLLRKAKDADEKGQRDAELDLGALKHAFTKLKSADQMDFVQFAADAVGAKLDLPFIEPSDEPDLTIPAALKRKGKKRLSAAA